MHREFKSNNDPSGDSNRQDSGTKNEPWFSRPPQKAHFIGSLRFGEIICSCHTPLFSIEARTLLPEPPAAGTKAPPSA
jgi:hypothetical protein